MSRAPAPLRSARMGPLARLPAFFALEDKRAVVAGGSQAAAWKVELLSAAGALVEVFTPAPGEDLLALADDAPRGAITIHERAWTRDDFAGAAIAVADCAGDAEAAEFTAAARAAGVPVNVIDRPAFSDFAFGAIVNRSPLVIGISTDGASPVFGQAIRAKIEALIPKGFARWAEAARGWRPRVQALALPFRGRRTFWERFTDRAESEIAKSRPVDHVHRHAGGACSAGKAAGLVVVGAFGDGDCCAGKIDRAPCALMNDDGATRRRVSKCAQVFARMRTENLDRSAGCRQEFGLPGRSLSAAGDDRPLSLKGKKGR